MIVDYRHQRGAELGMELEDGRLRGCNNFRANENPWCLVKSRASILWKLKGSTCVDESYLEDAEMRIER